MANNKFIELCDQLPEFCYNFAYSGLGEKGSGTRIGYVRDVLYFFEFAIDKFPYFTEKTPKELSVPDLKRITTNNINQYLTYMRDKGLSEPTRARRKTAIAQMYKYLVTVDKVIDVNPMDGSNKVKIQDKDYVVYLTDFEQDKLLYGIENGIGLTRREKAHHKHYVTRDLTIIFLFLDMGLRVSELHGLDIADVDLDTCSLIVTRKGNKLQKLYFSDESAKHLRRYIESRQTTEKFDSTTPLFISSKGTRLSIRAIQSMLEKYVRACLPDKTDISLHKLRSSFAMSFYRATGNDLLALQHRLGHQSITTTNVYAKAVESEDAGYRNWREK